MAKRSEGGVHRGRVLGGESSSLRGGAVPHHRWAQEDSRGEFAGHSKRIVSEVERDVSREESGCGTMSAGKRDGVQGRAPTLQQAIPLGSSKRARLDEDFRRDGQARGRACQVERARRRSRPRSPSLKEGEGGRRIFKVKQPEEEEEEVKEEKEERQGRRRRSQEDPRHQRSGGSSGKDRTGSNAPSSESYDEKGKEGGEEEVKEGKQFFVGEHKLRGFREPRRREQRDLWGRSPDKDHLEQGPWSTYAPNSESDAAVVGQAKWTTMGHKSISGPSTVFPVLADVPLQQDVWSHEPRDPVDLLCAGPFATGASGSGLRRPHPEAEEFGADSRGWRLQDCPEARIDPPRNGQPLNECGDVGCFEASPGGLESQSSFAKAVGKTWRRRLRLLGCQRKRKREGQQRQGQKGQLDKRQREGRQGQQREGQELREGQKAIESFEAATEEKREESHRMEGHGRESEPTQLPPVALQPFANVYPGEELPGCLGGPEGVYAEEVFQSPSMKLEASAGEVEDVGAGKKKVADLRSSSVESLEGLTFREMAPQLIQLFQECSQDACLKHSKVQTSGGMFPLPEKPQGLKFFGIHLADDAEAILLAICCALNSYFGVLGPNKMVPSKVKTAALRSLATYAETVRTWEEKFGGVTWERLLHTRSVDYRGEEVKVAKHFCWENLEPALPEQVGNIPLETVCELGTLCYVNNFEEYLLPIEAQVYTKPPRVMVEEGAWPRVCRGLVSSGLCEVLPLGEVYHLRGQPVLNGLFGVSKDEFSGSWEVFRLIMNLVPVNKLCRNLGGDVSTLPNWSGMTAYVMDGNHVTLMSSEDIRCFFYLFQVPKAWRRFLGFNKLVPGDQVPGVFKGKQCVLVSRVLPMGFLNSVSIAQHIHRRVARMALHNPMVGMGPHQEIRRDRPLPSADLLYRVYLDNFDVLELVDRKLAGTLRGEVSAQVLSLRQQYEILGMPRHPKKSVQRQDEAEIQGAWFNGTTGRVTPKPSKILKYVGLGLALLQANRATQKQLQIVCGGFVYCCMFRRALLGMLNAVWKFIVSFEGEPPFISKGLPPVVRLEISRFICAVPLAQMNLSIPFREDVTASDASEEGGGFCISDGVTAVGAHAATCTIRGDLPEDSDCVMVLTVGLFDGIAALRVAADALCLPMSGHVSCEVNQEGNRVVESHFPDSTFVSKVEDIDESMVRGWACQHSNVGVVVVGGGPPCQGVSGLNVSRKGALRDERSSLFPHVRRVYDHCKTCFPWAQVHYLMESVWSMDAEDRAVMSQSIGVCPYMIDSYGISLCRRPRLYWLSWELTGGQGVEISAVQGDGWFAFSKVVLKAEGAKLVGTEGLPTFTTARPRDSPGPRPAGLWQCSPEEVER